MKRKIALVLGAAGIIIGFWAIENLLIDRSFTETAVGRVEKRVGQSVIIRFHDERLASAPEQVYYTHSFPLDDRTQRLNVGDTVQGHYPMNGLNLVRLDREDSHLKPIFGAAVGAVLVIASGVLLLISNRNRKEPTSTVDIN